MISRFTHIVLVASVICMLPGDGQAKGKYRRTILGYRGTSGEFRLSGGNLMMHEGKPGCLFGTVKTPGTPERFSYIVIFKHGPAEDDSDSFAQSGNCMTSGNSGATGCAIEHNGKRIEADYDVKVKASDGTVRESLNIGGKPVDIASGRLFLIDLTSQTPTYKQIDVNQPIEVKAATTRQDVVKTVNQTLDKLKSLIPKDYWK